MAIKDNQAQEPSLGDLVSDLTQQFSGIAKAEIELAKAEVKNDLTKVMSTAVMFAIAGVLALYGLGLALVAAAWGLAAIGLPTWAGFLIVAGVLFLVVGVLAMLGMKSMKKINGKPELTIKHAKQTIEDIKPSASNDGETTRVKAGATRV